MWISRGVPTHTHPIFIRFCNFCHWWIPDGSSRSKPKNSSAKGKGTIKPSRLSSLKVPLEKLESIRKQLYFWQWCYLEIYQLLGIMIHKHAHTHTIRQIMTNLYQQKYQIVVVTVKRLNMPMPYEDAQSGSNYLILEAAVFVFQGSHKAWPILGVRSSRLT